MVKGSDLIKIYETIANKDNNGFTEFSLRLIQEEYNKKHIKVYSILTSLLEKIQENESIERPWLEEFSEIPLDRDRLLDLIQVVFPKKNLQDIIISNETQEKIKKILLEWKERSNLAQYGLKPIRKVLFYGPPGCGKTLCASIFAKELEVPLLIVKTDSIISSLLGESSINLRKIFESVQNKTNAVLFFDEFDSIAKKRIDQYEHGELRRLVSNLLQFIENSPNNILVIAATNHPDILDIAIWRRFEEIIEFSLPDHEQICTLMQLKMKNFDYNFEDLDSISNQLNGLSHADIEHICYNSIKKTILSGENIVTSDIFLTEVEDIIKAKNRIFELTNE